MKQLVRITMSGIFLLILCPPMLVAQPVYEGYYLYLGNYPQSTEPSWGQDVQGITHDNENWFISHSSTWGFAWIAKLWKIPVNLDLKGSLHCGESGVVCSELRDFDPIKMYKHLGDIEYYEYKSTGFLLVPLEDGANPAIAVFNPANLQYIAHAELPQHENAPWVAVNPVDGLIYTSHKGRMDLIYQYRFDWDRLVEWKENGQQGIFSIEYAGEFQVLDESGNVLSFKHMQGGAFSPSGDLLYINNGYYDSYDPHINGINVFDMETKRRIQQSTRGSGYFNYEYHPGGGINEEPEGLTIWDLDNVPNVHSGVSGQLHVLMLDNDWWEDDDVYLKHYTYTIFVDQNYSGEEQYGTPEEPFITVSDAYNLAWDGARIRIQAGIYPENITFSKRVEVVADGGIVTIGQ